MISITLEKLPFPAPSAIMLRLVECEMPYKHIDMALVRAIVTQASIWFIGIIIAQIYIQANFPGLAVRPFVRSSHKTS